MACFHLNGGPDATLGDRGWPRPTSTTRPGGGAFASLPGSLALQPDRKVLAAAQATFSDGGGGLLLTRYLGDSADAVLTVDGTGGADRITIGPGTATGA